MIILVADKFPADGLDALREAGGEVLYHPDVKGEGLTEAVRSSGAEVLVVRSTEVPRRFGTPAPRPRTDEKP